MSTNKVATVILMDVGLDTKQITDTGKSFFQRSKDCVIQILLRTMFSGENDEFGLILFGANKTEQFYNKLDKKQYKYKNMVELSNLRLPKWHLVDKLEDLEPTDCESNWVQAIILGLDFLQEETKGKRFRDKQVVLFSTLNFQEYEPKDIESLVNVFNLHGFKLVVITYSKNEDEIYDNKLMIDFISKIDTGVCLKIEEAEQDFKGYQQKRKMKRFTNAILQIGSDIQVPLKWLKVTSDSTNLQWTREMINNPDVFIPCPPPTKKDQTGEPNEPFEIKYEMDVQKSTKFGETEVLLSYADLEAMKRETGPSSFILLGCVKRERISRSMIIGSDVYVAISDSKMKRSQAMLSALVQALIQEKKFGLARRIATKNGKVHLGLLIPVSDDSVKAFYFVKLPFADYIKSVPYKPLAETKDSQLTDLIDNYIDKMTIDSKDKEFFIKEPVFQNRCDLLYKISKGADLNIESKPILPDYINKLIDPHPELKEGVKTIVNKLVECYPIQDTDTIRQKEIKLEANIASVEVKNEAEELQLEDVEFGDF